mgnify:CR=1 FL=1|tara:strand:+ start:6532 stop:7965 length:1434 start_codon:yes stop_codon:yes gene_type:complete
MEERYINVDSMIIFCKSLSALIKFLFIFSFLFILTCNPHPNIKSSGKDMIRTIKPDGSEKYMILDSDYIFNEDELHTFELKIPEGSLKKLDTDPSAEEYIEGMLIFDGDTLSPVGIRYKGNIGAWVGCLSGKNIFKPSGKKICTKLSMKVKINWNGRNQKFYGLKKLQFHSQNNDPTQLHERLGYWFYREMDIPAPRSVHAQLIINDEYSGLYALTEQIDDRFTDYHFSDGSGNLYKEIWPLNHNGNVIKEKKIRAGLKTNENENTSIELFKVFGEMMANADSISSREIIKNYMDINSIISYVVVDRAIRNDDGVFHWYNFFLDVSFNHNYYWYEHPKENKLYLIPWDLDNAFDNITFENPITFIADDWGEISNDCKPFKYGDWGIKQRSAGCDKIIDAWISFRKEYQQLQTKFQDNLINKSLIMIDTWSDQIKDATINAEELHTDALSYKKWVRSIELLKAQISLMETRLSYMKDN